MLYAITDRRLFGGSEAESRQRLLDQAVLWTENGVAFIQLREKDLASRELAELARGMVRQIRSAQRRSGAASTTRLLINGRPDVAVAVEADGVHLPSGADTLTPEEVRTVFAAAGCAHPPIISVSCHSLGEVEAAQRANVDCILFAPVFEKIIAGQSGGQQTLPGTGLEMLRRSCIAASPVPVFALGGVTAENAQECLEAGAAGVAAIRMMMEPPHAWVHILKTAPEV